MGLLGTTTQESYYSISKEFIGDGTTVTFVLGLADFDPLPSEKEKIEIFINNIRVKPLGYSYTVNGGSTTGTIVFSSNAAYVDTEVQQASGAPNLYSKILVRQNEYAEQYGNYQNVTINDIINNFIISYVGEDKIINKVKRSDIAYHAQRGLQELSYDTLKSFKSQEIEIPPSLVMPIPHDYVNYVKLTWLDQAGVERIIYPTRNTSNPSGILQDSEYKYMYDENGNLSTAYNSNTWERFSQASNEAAENNENVNTDILNIFAEGRRYGISPENAQSNGSFFIDQLKDSIYFSSNIFGKIVTLKYISDSLGTDDEMIVHKFAEEAMYKYIAHAVLASKVNVPEYVVARFKKERFAAIRTAKLRLSNLKSEELVQIMRNKSKQIKH
jgi:hypothetical protein